MPMMKDSMDALATGKKTKRIKKPVVHMNIKPTTNKGFTVEHIEHGGEPTMGPSKTFAFPDVSGLHAHIDKHYGKKNKSEAAEGKSDSPAEEKSESKAEKKAELKPKTGK